MGTFSITVLFVALLTLVHMVFTVLVGAYRAKSGILLADGGDRELLLRMRAHANFTETVPITLLAMAASEFMGAPAALLWTGGALLFGGRLFHYIGIRQDGTGVGRGLGMVATLLSMLTFSVYCLLGVAGVV